MIQASSAFLDALSQGQMIIPQAVITFANGDMYTPGLGDYSVGGNITDGAGGSTFPIGEAIERSIELEFINNDGRMDEYSFEGAEIDLWLRFHDPDIPAILLGKFFVSGPESLGETVIVHGVDFMYKADAVYTTSLDFTANPRPTLADMLSEICTTLGIRLGTQTFTNSDFEVENSPADGKRTFRQVIGWIAMTAGGNARINSNNLNMEIVTYNFTYTSGVQELSSFINLKAGRDQITITGVKAGAGDDSPGVMYGTSGYVLCLENPLWAGKKQEAATRVGAVLVGGTLRDFEGSYIAYPLAEFMDKVKVKNRRGITFYTVLTDIDFNICGATIFKNTAESASRQGGVYSSAVSALSSSTKALVDKFVDTDSEIGALSAYVTGISNKAICVLSEMTPVGIADDYALVGDGLAVVDSTSRICVYEVIPGQVVSIKASKDNGGVFQWQNARTTYTAGTPATLVGDPVTAAFDGLVAAPVGASYLAVSQLKTNTTNYIGKPAKGTLASS